MFELTLIVHAPARRILGLGNHKLIVVAGAAGKLPVVSSPRAFRQPDVRVRVSYVTLSPV